MLKTDDLLSADGPILLTRKEVAAIFRVNPTTVTRWGAEGTLETVPTPTGRRLYPRSSVRALLAKRRTAGM